MNILLDKIRISNYRALKNVEVGLSKDITLLVGANNAGKTTFLRALNIALGIDRKNLSREDIFIDKGENTIPINRSIIIDVLIIPVNNNLERDIFFNSAWTSHLGNYISQTSDGNSFLALRAKYSFNNEKQDYILERYSLNEWREFSDNWDSTPKGIDISTNILSSIPLYFIDAQRDIQEDIKNRNSFWSKLTEKIINNLDTIIVGQIEQEINTLNETIIDSSEILKHLREVLKELVKTVSNTSGSIEITPITKHTRDLYKGMDIMIEDGMSESFPLASHGMGTRSWMSLLAFKAFVLWLLKQAEENNDAPYHSILALEEPEAHLHPNAQRQIYIQLKEIKGQKIISTHSPYIAFLAQLNEIRHFNKSSSETKINEINLTGLSDEDIRKIQIEVLNTRGELLFANAIVLFEGKTEEQALPIFAKKYWGMHHFEAGINFIGTTSDSNYIPFLRLINAFNIVWFIFADGEEKARNKIKETLESIGINSIPFPQNVIILPNNNNFEQYLLEEAYQPELKRAVIEFQRPNFHNIQHENAKILEIENWSDEDLINYLDNWKAKLSPIYSTIISELPDKNRRFPPKIKELLDAISIKLNLTIHPDNL